MHEIVKMYDLLVDYNTIANEDEMISIEIFTRPLAIDVWVVTGDPMKGFASFQSINKWLKSRISGLVND